MKAELVGFWGIAVLFNLVHTSPLVAQEAVDTTTAQKSDQQRSSLWTGLGLTDVVADVDAPGSLIELGVEWSPWSLLGLGAAVGSGGIAEDGICQRDGLSFECRQLKTIYSASLGARFYAFRNRVYSGYGMAQIGVQTHDLGRFQEIGLGMLFNTLERLGVGIEIRRRFGWPDPLADGSIYVFRVARRLGEGGASGGSD